MKVGLKCGGSDGFSGITANPLVGRFCDKLTAMGGSCVLTEVPEMFGAEHLLMQRCEGVRSDIVTAGIENNATNNYILEIDKLEVVSNNGFNDKGIANISFKLPGWDYKRVYGTVKVQRRI